MRKVETAHARARVHCKRFGELNAGIFLRLQQFKERAFFRVIR